MITIQFRTGPQQIVNRLRSKGPQIVNVLLTKVNMLMTQLSSYIVSRKLSGQVLARRSGKLAGSVRAIPATLQGGKIVGGVQAGGGPAFYANIHEYGGISLYPIFSVNARALAFVTHGKKVFAKSVIHPPAKERSFMRTSQAENAANIRAELQEAINEVLNQ